MTAASTASLHDPSTDARAPRQSTRHFVRHYAEMLVAMIAGMVVLGVPAEAALAAVGSGISPLEVDAPAVALLGMATTMTVPMVGWMRYRGHAWRPCAEMAASMFIPTFVAIALMQIVTDFGVLMTVEHALMLPSMLVAMLLRRDEYACAPGRRHAVALDEG